MRRAGWGPWIRGAQRRRWRASEESFDRRLTTFPGFSRPATPGSRALLFPGLGEETGMTEISGIWLPIITPFADGAVDLAGYERLPAPPPTPGGTGVVPPARNGAEVEALVGRTVAVVGGRVPVFVGVGGNATAKVLKTLARLERYSFAGIVSVCPYYNCPSQDGLRAHFTRIAEATAREILIYNIPYRTSVNLANDTLLRLAELPNIVGVKDSSGNLPRARTLLRRRPPGFAVMTGDDASLYTMLAHGGDGGMLASAHLQTE